MAQFCRCLLLKYSFSPFVLLSLFCNTGLVSSHLVPINVLICIITVDVPNVPSKIMFIFFLLWILILLLWKMSIFL